eukprot:9223897-Pyramimonas_sp.AAC.1
MAERPRGLKTRGPDLGGAPDAVSPVQAMTRMGSAGQPAESDFDSGTDTDTSSDDEATAWTTLICLHSLPKSSKLSGYVWAIKNTGVVGGDS